MYIRSSSGLPGNPIANAITIVLGFLALIAAFAFGFVLLAALLIAATAFVSFISLRLWWLRRKLRRQGYDPFAGGEPRSGHADVKGYIIDADYDVIDEDRDRAKRRSD